MNAFLIEYWPHLAFVASTLAGLAAAVHAAMTKDEVRAATGWVAVVLLSPFFGAFIYLIAGVNRVRRQAVKRRRRSRSRAHEEELNIALEDAIAFPSLARLGDSVSPFRLRQGNRVTPLCGGDEAYPAMLEAIRSAKRSIALATYIFDHDEAGLAFVEALREAHARGVLVKVLIDGVGSRYSKPPIARLLAKSGIATALFMSDVIGLKLPYANLRSHRKILVVDGHVGFTGGMNIRAHFLSSVMGEEVAHDTHFRIEGPLVEQVMTVFAEDWSFTTNENLQGSRWFARHETASFQDGVPARAVPSGPDASLESTHAMIMGALAVARERVLVATPYFLPDQQLVAAFGVAARRGISVDIVIPKANNLKLVDHAMTAQLDQVLRHGCRVWRARGPFDHSKLLTIDGAWSYIGSSNLDPRSLRLNFELDVEIHDAGLAAWIEARIRSRIDDAEAETLETLAALPTVTRLRNRFVWLASPYL
jgi:cardiolipin synthase A/B